MTKKIIGVILILVLLSSLCGLASAAISPYTIKLTVQQSMLTIYPPIIIYTAQLVPIPPASSTIPQKADFCNITTPTGPITLLGSAPFDNTGKAVFSRQMNRGSYVGQAFSVINNVSIKSNTVPYVVR